jgi:molybdate transport system permease protein
MNHDWQPLAVTFKLASVTTLGLFIICVPLAYWLACTRFRAKPLIETLTSMPLVLPPSVLGFYLLVAFNPTGPLGRFLESAFDLRLVFSFAGLVLGSMIFSLPFMVQPIKSGFENLPISLTDASYTLGKSKLETLIKVLLPNIRPALLTGIVLSFAHTLGEFGVVLMIGGNIPGRTQAASIAIYNKVEALNYPEANFYAAVLFVLAFIILLSTHLINKKFFKLT